MELKGNYDDILIVKNAYITDSSYANILFYDGGKWFTPHMPLLAGTCRARLLKESKICEMKIKIDDIKKFESFCLINALNEGMESPLPIENIKIL
jgi:4-amino-4-deoxychorismate lyase